MTIIFALQFFVQKNEYLPKEIRLVVTLISWYK